jgi:hypothetical protein
MVVEVGRMIKSATEVGVVLSEKYGPRRRKAEG